MEVLRRQATELGGHLATLSRGPGPRLGLATARDVVIAAMIRQGGAGEAKAAQPRHAPVLPSPFPLLRSQKSMVPRGISTRNASCSAEFLMSLLHHRPVDHWLVAPGVAKLVNVHHLASRGIEDFMDDLGIPPKKQKIEDKQ